MMQKHLHVIIIGGSLSGLFTGVVLKRLGHNVTILERDNRPWLRHRGAGIILGSDVQDFLHSYVPPQRSYVVASQVRHYIDRSGAIIASQKCDQVMASWDVLYHVLRAQFDGLCSVFCDRAEPLPGDGDGVYHFDQNVTSVQDADHATVEVHSVTESGQESVRHADLVIGADGPSSVVRRYLEPDAKRRYGGYVAWRGVVNEGDISQEARNLFVGSFTFFHAPRTQIIAYTIPGTDGQLEEGHRLINWVWYCDSAEGSQEHAELMTDRHGKLHHFNVPIDGMRAEVWFPQVEKALSSLPPQFSELVSNTTEPFVQSITDVLPSKMVFFGGKLLLVGDAVSTFRPHTAASTNQAALHALMLVHVFSGVITLSEWEETLLDYAKTNSEFGIELGDRNELGSHPILRPVLATKN